MEICRGSIFLKSACGRCEKCQNDIVAIAKSLNYYLHKTDEETREVACSEVTNNICLHCFGTDKPCYCWRDE
jgi:hypothetical protein